MTIQTVYNDLTALKNTSVKADKITLLKQFQSENHADTIEVLRFLNDPQITTGLSAKKIDKNVSYETVLPLPSILDMINYLKVNNTGSNQDIAQIQAFIAIQPDDTQTFVKTLLTKSFKSGVSAKFLNDVYGRDFITTFEPQLAKSYSKHKDKLLTNKDWIAITTKYDGHRTLTHSDTQKSFTRQGKPLLDMTDIKAELNDLQRIVKEFMPNAQQMLDGEILIDQSDSPKEEWFNETGRILRRNGEKTNIKYHIFDILPQNEFYNHKQSSLNYQQRRQILDMLFSYGDFKYLELAPLHYAGTDHTEINKWYQWAMNNHEEGIMINLNTPYYCKRTDTLLKVKPVLSADLEIIGFEPGDKFSAFEHTLGNLLVDFNGTIVGVGSGLSIAMRDEIWNNQDNYLGKIAEIGYTSVSTNQNNDKLNLRFPRFKCIREDKTIDDINIES